MHKSVRTSVHALSSNSFCAVVIVNRLLSVRNRRVGIIQRQTMGNAMEVLVIHDGLSNIDGLWLQLFSLKRQEHSGSPLVLLLSFPDSTIIISFFLLISQQHHGQQSLFVSMKKRITIYLLYYEFIHQL